MKTLKHALLAATCLLMPTVASAAESDWMTQVGEALGKPGTGMPGEIYRVALPRSDLKVTASGVEIKPGFALGGWLAFHKTSADEATAMGDLVLLESEINPVMKKLTDSGIQITAVHNHLLGEQPKVM